MSVKKYVVDTIEFRKGVADITDPCYPKDVWCRINNVEIHPGTYTCVYWKQQNHTITIKGKQYQDNRVTRMGVYLNGKIPNKGAMKFLDCIGVDAGLAGVYEEKEDFTEEQWQDFCDDIETQDYLVEYNGFCTSSGYGDGEYPVYVHTNDDGLFDAIEIRFIG